MSPTLAASADSEPSQTLRLPVSADTWVSSARGEDEGNNGGSGRLKTKSYQEMTLLDLDPAPLRGRVIERATLHFRRVSGPPLRRASVSSVATPWIEGRSAAYERETGAASFRWAETGRRAWTDTGGDLSEVVLSAGNTRWSFADAVPPDAHGWQSLAVEPLVVATRVAGLGFGFLLFDDVGSEYERDGNTFAYHPFPNRFLSSREAGADSAPYWTIVLGAADSTPPRPVENLVALCGHAADDGIEVSWDVPADPPGKDEAGSGTLGFLMRYSTEADFDWDAGREVPSYLVPKAGAPKERVRARLKQLALPSGARVQFAVRAVDAAGNVSGESRVGARLTDVRSARPLVRPATSSLTGGLPPLRLGTTEVAILDELDKVELNAKELPPSMGSPSAPGRVTLVGAAGEWLGFQIALRGPTSGLRVSFRSEEDALRAAFYVARGVDTPAGRFPDPLEPWDGASEFDFGPDAIRLLFVDVHVAGEEWRTFGPSSVHAGELTLTRGDERLELDLRLARLGQSVPHTLSFVPEMNAYDLPPPPYEIEWYRLAHEHRTNLNVLRYNWQGGVHAGCGPQIVDGGFDWTEFDARFGPLLDGSAFQDGSRGAVPVEMFYLPLNEKWPVDLEPHFKGGYWADTALDATYWSEFRRFAQLFQRHIEASNWNRTRFEFYLNNKLYHKDTDWRRSSAPWIFDEPTHTQDFFALRCYGQALREAVSDGRDGCKVLFRVDVSRPQWQRDLLDGLVGVNVVGAAFESYRERVLERKRSFQERLLLYASANAVEKPNTMPVAWCIDAWSKGADGVIPWQTIGRAESWKHGDAQALLYPPRDGQPGPPRASLRLKAFRRGQQDVEMLEDLRRTYGVSRDEIARRVRAAVDLRSNSKARFEDDAGELEYPYVTARDLLALRWSVWSALLNPR